MDDLSEKTLIARLEEENGEMMREMEMLKQQQVILFSLFFHMCNKTRKDKEKTKLGEIGICAS